MCPAFSGRHSNGGQNKHKNYIKIRFSLFLKVIFVSHCHLKENLWNHSDNFLEKNNTRDGTIKETRWGSHVVDIPLTVLSPSPLQSSPFGKEKSFVGNKKPYCEL